MLWGSFATAAHAPSVSTVSTAKAPRPSGAQLARSTQPYFQPVHRVRQTVAGRLGALGQFPHSQRAVGCFRQHDQDLVVSEGHDGVTLELVVELGQQLLGGS
jgi:hypothetical protein